MAKKMTEDEVRDKARTILGFDDSSGVRCGVGQLTTFNQLGFKGVLDKPDGWYLPENANDVAIILEAKASGVSLGGVQVDELIKNVRIAQNRYENVVGILYNGYEVRIFKGEKEIEDAPALQNKEHYLSLFAIDYVDKERIYELTARINNCLHFEFGIKNLYHRMIFTACALIAKRYGAFMKTGMGYLEFHSAILNTLNNQLYQAKSQNQKINILVEVYSEIKMNLNFGSEDVETQRHVKELISQFIAWIEEISMFINSDAWRGEDVMGIFFNEFNRYRGKSESGQVFTPEHITDFMYRILDVNKDDRVLDATCGSGGFLVKAMANMIQEAGGDRTDKAELIKKEQLFGIENDREIYALACANMLLHKDGKTKLEHLDARHEAAATWIKSLKITKVLMNPPFENKYGCMRIVENVLDSVNTHTLCGFILPEKKLEKMSSTARERLFGRHRLLKVIKLPEEVFFGVGVTTSIFVFEAGVPQDGREFFACYMDSDGLETVKNKGRHDVLNRWQGIEDFWVQVIRRQSGHETVQWNDPNVCLSYQLPQPPLVLRDEDFAKSAIDFVFHLRGIDERDFREKLIDKVMYESVVSSADDAIVIELSKGARAYEN